MLYAIPPKQKSRYVHKTCRVDSLLNRNCTESVMIMHTVDLHFKYFLKDDTNHANHSWTPCRSSNYTYPALTDLLDPRHLIYLNTFHL